MFIAALKTVFSAFSTCKHFASWLKIHSYIIILNTMCRAASPCGRGLTENIRTMHFSVRVGLYKVERSQWHQFRRTVTPTIGYRRNTTNICAKWIAGQLRSW